MKRNVRLFGAGLLFAVCLAALPTLADEGRIPIWTAPTLISADGKYFLSRNIVAPAGSGPAIVVAAAVDHVDIDLNGFTVFGDPGGHPGVGVIEIRGPRRSVTIRNGEVRHLGPAGHAINVIAGLGSIVERVVIEDVKTIDGDVGIHLEEVLSFALRRNMINESGAEGILVTGFGVPLPVTMTGTIEDNVVRAALADCIHVEASHAAVAVRTNRIDSCGGAGLAMIGGDGFILAENTIQDAAADGIFAAASNNSKIYNNSIHRSGVNGMTLITLGGFLVLDNVSSGNAGDGMFVDGFINHIDRNVLNFNGACGLHFGMGSANNTFGRNTAKFNDTAFAGACAGVCGAPVPPHVVCPPPYGGAGFLALPELCNEGTPPTFAPAPGANDSLCDNMMPGPRS